MSVEAEIKARLVNPAALRERLDGWAESTADVYRDTYLDTADRALDAVGAELRVRTIEHDSGGVRHVVTFKGSPVDQATQSKPEHETGVDDPRATIRVFAGLGYTPVLAFTKECTNYRFARDGRDFLATVVTVPELEGTFLEVETQAGDDDVASALAAVRRVLADLGVTDQELTIETYSDAVRTARGG